MNIINNVFKTSLGRKYLMAVTGFFLVLFLLGHMAGNLQFFLGKETLNRYGHFLQSNPELIWPARFGLLLMIGLHIWSAAKLTRENRAARPVAYASYEAVGSTYASRTMIMSGLIVLAFVIYHLLHYTVRVKAINLTGQDFAGFKEPIPGGVQVQHDIHRMILVGFSNLWVSGFYALGVGLLCFHLSHGISSMFQSVGWRNDRYRPFLDKLACALAILIFVGYVSIPVAVLLGFGKEVK